MLVKGQYRSCFAGIDVSPVACDRKTGESRRTIRSQATGLPWKHEQYWVKGQPGVQIELAVSYQHRRKHLPVATTRRAASAGSPASPSLSSKLSLRADPRTGSLAGSIRDVEPLLPCVDPSNWHAEPASRGTNHPECDRRISLD